MTDDNVSRLPDLSVVLDLDSEERPKEDVKPPYTVLVGKKTITFADPDEIDWRVLATVDIPADLLRASLSDEDRKHLQGLNLPTWKFKRIMDTYYEHYDMERKIRDARQQAQFAGL